MTENVANIGVKVDTSDADRGVKSLEALAAAGPKVERALDGVEASAGKTGKSLKSLGEGAGKGLDDLGKKAPPAADALNKLGKSAGDANKATKELGAVNITGLTRLNASAAEAATSAKAMASSMSVASAGVRGLGTATSTAERGMRGFASAAETTATALRNEASALGSIRTSVAAAGAAHTVAAQQALALSGAIQALTTQTAALTASSAAAAVAIQRISDASKDGAKGVSATGKAADDAARSTMGLGASARLLGAAFATMGIAVTVREMARMADASTNIESRLRLVTGSAQELASVQGQLFATAQGARVGFESLVGTYTQMARATKELGISQRDMLGITQTISQAVTISGGSAQSAQAALIQLSQGFASGTLRGEELNSVMEQTPRLAQAIAEGMGKTVGELRKMGGEGQLTASAVLEALQKSAGSVQSEFGKMTMTIEQASTQAENSVLRLVGVIDKMTGASSAAAGGISQLSRGVDSLATDMERIGNARGFSDTWFLLFNNTRSVNGELAIARENLADTEARLKRMPTSIYLRADFADAKREVAELEARLARLQGLSGASFAGAGRGTVNPPTAAEITARRGALDADISKYLSADSRQTKSQRAAEEVANAIKLNGELVKRAAAEGNVNQLVSLRKALEVEIANINEKHKEKGGGASAAKREQSAYESLIGAIKTKIATNEEEIKLGGRLSESDKLRIKLTAELEAGAKTLTAAHKANALSLLETLDAQERQMRASKSAVQTYLEQQAIQAELTAEQKRLDDQRKAGIAAVEQYTRGVTEASGALQVEIAGIGKSATERQRLIDVYNIEILKKKELAAIDANRALSPDDRAWAISQVEGGAATSIINADAAAAAKSLSEYLDPQRAQDFGQALSDAFEGALSPLKKLTQSFDTYTKAQARSAKETKNLKSLYDGGFLDPQGYAEKYFKVEQQSLQDSLGLYGDVAGAASQFFDQGTKGYKALQAASTVFHTAQQLGALASQAAVLAGETTKQSAYATTSMLSALTAPWPISFAAWAAVGAMIASLGVTFSGGGGGSGGGYTGIQAGGTGTVLGMEGQQSESLGNAIDILADNSKIELGYTQKMLSELTKVREGIQGLAGTASTDFFIRGFAGASFGDAFLDSGIGFFPGQTIADIIEKGVQGMGFNLIFDKGAQAMWRNLDEEFTTGVGRVLANVAETVYTAADALGLNDAALQERMLSLIPTLGDTSTYMQNGMFGMQGGGLVSLKDMTGEEIQKELEAIFSAVGDQMAAAALPALRPFQSVGEGMFETLIKVTTGIETAEYALEKFGLRAIDYTDIIRKQGDVGVEIMRQTIMGAEAEMAMYRYGTAGSIVSSMTPQSGLSSVIETFVGDASELEDLYASLLDVRSAMKSVGLQALDLSRDMIRGAGGLESLQSGFDSYFENYFSETEKLEARTARLTEEFARIGVQMPVGVAGFRALVESIDTGTEAGQYLTGQLMGVADAFYEVASASGQAALSLADIVADMVSRASDFLTPGQMQAQSVQRIQSTLAAGGVNVSFEQILGYSRQQFAADIRDYYAAGNETMVRLMHSIADDYLSISQSTVDALQAQQQEASQTVSALQADVDKWTSMRKSAQDLSRSIGLSISGGTGEADLWNTVNGTGDLDARIKAATELKGIIERSASVQMQAWQTALSSAQSMLTVGKQLKSYVDSLKVGSLSALTPAEQMGEALRQYEETLAKARGGDKDAQGALQNIANSYLTLAQSYSPGMYSAIFDTVTKQLDALGGSLISEAQAEVNRQQALISAAEAANGLSAEQIAKLTTLQSAVDKMVATADVKITTTNAELAIANAKLSSIDALLASVNDVWTYLPEQQAGMFDGGVNRIIEALVGLPKEFARNIAAVVGVDVSTVPGFASGGVHSGGWRIVGERGPELEFTAPSRIYNNGQSSQMLAQANAELVAEVRALRAEMAAVKAEVARSGDKAAMASLEGGQRTAAAVERGIEKGARGNALAKRAVPA